MKFLLKIYKNLISLTNIILGCILGISVLIICAQVYFRYVVGSSLVWSEEAARYLQIWLVTLGSWILMSQDKHIVIDILYEKCSDNGKTIIKIVSKAIMLVSFSIFLYYSLVFIFRARHQVSPALQLPMSVLYWAAPVMFLLMIIELLISFFTFKKQNKTIYISK